jgi:hypothetical protein
MASVRFNTADSDSRVETLRLPKIDMVYMKQQHCRVMTMASTVASWPPSGTRSARAELDAGVLCVAARRLTEASLRWRNMNCNA